MAEETTTQQVKDTQRKEAANQQQELQKENEGLLRKLINLFKRLLGGSRTTATDAPKNTEKPAVGPKETLISSWDALTDKADKLQQVFKNELQDLNEGKPSPPEGNHPDELSTYQAELQSYNQHVEQTAERYSLAVTELQKERDGLLALALENGQELPGIEDMDAKLGAYGEGPEHATFKAMRQEVSDALSGHQQQDTLSTPNADIRFEEGIARGGESRMAIGDRLLEITQQGMANGGNVDQKALDREFAKLMPAAEEGILNRRGQMEQKANLAYASAMTEVLGQYLSAPQEGHVSMTSSELQSLREQALGSEQLLALTDIEAQNVPFQQDADLRVDAFRIERQTQMDTFQKGYGSLADQAGWDSSSLATPQIRQFEATEGVDLIRSQEERIAIAKQVGELVSGAIKARHRNGDKESQTVDFEAVEALLTPLTKTSHGVGLTEGDALNQLRNAELADTLLSSAQAVDRTSDNQKWLNPVSMAVATSNPSQEEIKKHYLDDHGKLDIAIILEQSEKTLEAYQRNIAAERKEQAPETPSMSM